MIEPHQHAGVVGCNARYCKHWEKGKCWREGGPDVQNGECKSYES